MIGEGGEDKREMLDDLAQSPEAVESRRYKRDHILALLAPDEPNTCKSCGQPGHEGVCYGPHEQDYRMRAAPPVQPCPAGCVNGIAVDYGIGPDEACPECGGSGDAQKKERTE